MEEFREKYLEIGAIHGLFAGAITFLGTWGYCTYQYGFLLGFGLGWIASGIMGLIVCALTSWLWLPLDLLILFFVLTISNDQNTKPSQTKPRLTLNDTEKSAPEQPKHPTLSDLQALRNKQSENSAANTNPPPKHMITAQTLAACLLDAANTYQIPPAVLIGIMEVEGGRVGDETTPDPTYLYFMGPMHISNRMISEVARVWNVDFDTAHDWLKNDGCVNMHVSAWVLAQKLSESGTLYQAIGLYHSNDPTAATDYTKKVIDAMDKKGLIYHDAPMPK